MVREQKKPYFSCLAPSISPAHTNSLDYTIALDELALRGPQRYCALASILDLGNVALFTSSESCLIETSEIRIHGKPLSKYWRKRNVLDPAEIPNERDWLGHYAILDPAPVIRQKNALKPTPKDFLKPPSRQERKYGRDTEVGTIQRTRA